MDQIDAVVTWVDGDDPVLAAKRAEFGGHAPKGINSAKTRFADSGELYYSLASLLKNAPFLRKIFVVTDQQTPGVLEPLASQFSDGEMAKIVIVDHREMFRNHLDRLPVFNSNCLETMLYDIPDLSEKFIFLNDDFMILRPLTPADFFKDGAPILRGKYRPVWPVRLRINWRRFMKQRFGADVLNRMSFKEYQTTSTKMVHDGPQYYWHDHTPHPILRSKVEAYFDTNPAHRDHNLTHRFRHYEDFSVVGLFYALEIAGGNTNLADPSLIYCKPSDKKDLAAYLARKSKTAEEKNVMFACLQSMDEIDDAPRHAFFEWIAAKIGVPPLHRLK